MADTKRIIEEGLSWMIMGLYAGILKLLRPDLLLDDIQSYQVAPYRPAYLASLELFALEVIAGLVFLLRRWRSEAAWLLAAMMSFYHRVDIGLVARTGISLADVSESRTNTKVFHTYVREVLIKNELTVALIEAVAAEVCFLPAYSPDLNPIEMMLSKMNALLPKAQARNHDDLLAIIASALNAVTTQDALSWFAACGYNFTLNALRGRLDGMAAVGK